VNATVAPVEVTDDTETLTGSDHLALGAALADRPSAREMVTRDTAVRTAVKAQSLFMIIS
jgi:hypothetical protein